MRRTAAVLAFLAFSAGTAIAQKGTSAQANRDRLREHAIETATGVKVRKCPHQLDDGAVVHDNGNGLVVFLVRQKIFISQFVCFEMPLKPPCRDVIQDQVAKLFVFADRGNGFRRLRGDRRDHDAQEHPDHPKTDPSNDKQEPGELKDAGGGRYQTFDLPGSELAAMPADVQSLRWRFCFKASITCLPNGPVLRTFYWMVELTVPHSKGSADTSKATSVLRQISSKDFEQAEERFGRND